MLKQLRRWLGWDSDSQPFDFGALQTSTRSRSAAPNATVAPQASAPAASASAKKQPAPVASPRLLEVLDNPQLTLDRPSEDGFDPYNTGAFNRSTSWEKISRHKR